MNILMTTPSNLLDALVAPSSVYRRVLDLKRNSGLVFLALLFVSMLGTYFFYSGMSIDWLLQQQLAAVENLSISEKQAFVDMMRKTAHLSGPIAVLTTAVYHVLLTMIVAGYLSVNSSLGFIRDSQYKFGDWFSFSVWSQVPWFLNYIGLVTLVLTSSSKDLPLSLVSYASVNSLIFNLSSTHDLYRLASEINLFHFWSLAILIFGLLQAFGLSLAKATSIVLAAPLALIAVSIILSLV